MHRFIIPAALAAVLALTGCATLAPVSASTAPAPKPAAEAAPVDLDPESLLRAYLATQGSTPEQIDAQVNVATAVCSVADELGADRAVEIAFLNLMEETDAVAKLGATAIGAGVVALCPEHAHAVTN